MFDIPTGLVSHKIGMCFHIHSMFILALVVLQALEIVIGILIRMHLKHGSLLLLLHLVRILLCVDLCIKPLFGA